ncbi:MAG TPA: PepSY domain-containing protein [Sneathiellales bacterium]|nr:PepSY domain-containing protein [Sneathiellales bacterium]
MTELSPNHIERRRNGDRRKIGKRKKLILKWHRTLGLVSALFLVFLAITGVILNHGPALGLDGRTIDSPWLLDWYGMELRDEIISYRAGDHWLSWSDDHLFLDGRAVVERAAELNGVARTEDVIVVATLDTVYLLTREGDLIERLTGAALPGPIVRLGETADNQLIVETEAGRFAAKAGFMGWAPTELNALWSVPTPTSDPIRQKVLVDYRGEGLPWSRVLLDLHSGRLFGSWGPYVMDATAIILVILALTGLINWKRRR